MKYKIGDIVNINNISYQDDNIVFNLENLDFKIIDINSVINNDMITIEAQESDGELYDIEVDGNIISVHDTQVHIYNLLINSKYLIKKEANEHGIK